MTTPERTVEEIVEEIKNEISPDGKTIHCGGSPYDKHFSIIAKTLQAERQRCEKIVLKGERRRIIEQIRDERDTYWKERVREEVEGLKFVPRIGRDKNGKIISYTSPIEEGHNNALDTLLDNLK